MFVQTFRTRRTHKINLKIKKIPSLVFELIHGLTGDFSARHLNIGVARHFIQGECSKLKIFRILIVSPK